MLGHSGGEGEYCGAEPLGIGQPRGLEQWPGQAAHWPGLSLGGLLIPLEDLSSAPVFCGAWLSVPLATLLAI